MLESSPSLQDGVSHLGLLSKSEGKGLGIGDEEMERGEGGGEETGEERGAEITISGERRLRNDNRSLISKNNLLGVVGLTGSGDVASLLKLFGLF